MFLKPEVDQGLVTVLGDRPMPIVRIRNSRHVRLGQRDGRPRFVPLLDRIGEALKEEPGPVKVIGYTDNQPIRTVQFPSNFQLSRRAPRPRGAIIARALGDPGATHRGGPRRMPIRCTATRRRRGASRTGASRSCCARQA